MNPNGAAPADAKLLAWAQLHELRGHISGMTSGSDDPYTKIHLAECGVRIDRALNATQSIGGASRMPSQGTNAQCGEGLAFATHSDRFKWNPHPQERDEGCWGWEVPIAGRLGRRERQDRRSFE